MSYQPRFRFEQRGPTGGVIFDGAYPIGEIRELRLCNVRLYPLLQSSSSSPPPLLSSPRRSETRRSASEPDEVGGENAKPGQGSTIISEVYPLPLYWHQYANHQYPERNAGSHGRLDCVASDSSKISLEIESASHSREVASRYLLDVTYSDQLGSYVFDFRCRLSVPDGKQWLVTHNPSHGELEFCNFWPEGVFIAGKAQPSSPPEPSSPRRRGSKADSKLYQACYLQTGGRVERILHHHLETSDKHDIGMGPGDRFLYLLEDENPVIEICSSEPLAAGVCAYMWDTHFAYRVCKEGKDVELPSGSSYDAHFKLYAVGREEGEKIVAAATTREAPELATIPIYVDGLNTFSTTVILANAGIHATTFLDPRLRGDDGGGGNDRGAASDVWPWEHEPAIPGVIEYALDRTEGHADNASVRIHAVRPVTGRWLATTLGPAFGGAPFENEKRYRLSAFVKSRDLKGAARIGIRLHRSGVGDVFDIASYETYYSDNSATSVMDWTLIEVTTPLIFPAPDRMHLLLEMDGVGTCWFDDVLFERNV